MNVSITANQIRSGTFTQLRGSWDPGQHPAGREWGRVGETAVSILCLEVYLRYLEFLQTA